MLRNYRKEITTSFIFLVVFYVSILIYKTYRPFDFYGIERRILFLLIPLGLVVVLLWLPYEYILKVSKQIMYRKKRKKKVKTQKSISLHEVKRVLRLTLAGGFVLVIAGLFITKGINFILLLALAFASAELYFAVRSIRQHKAQG